MPFVRFFRANEDTLLLSFVVRLVTVLLIHCVVPIVAVLCLPAAKLFLCILLCIILMNQLKGLIRLKPSYKVVWLNALWIEIKINAHSV